MRLVVDVIGPGMEGGVFHCQILVCSHESAQRVHDDVRKHGYWEARDGVRYQRCRPGCRVAILTPEQAELHIGTIEELQPGPAST